MKKRIFSLTLALLLTALSLLGCNAPDADGFSPPDSTAVTDGQGNPIRREDIAHTGHYFIGEVQYYDTVTSRREPAIQVLCTPDEAAAFAVENVAETPLSHYDDAFFKAKDVLAVQFSCSSGGHRYELARLDREGNGGLQLELRLIVDGDTDDVGGWLLLIPVDKGSIEKGEIVSLYHLPYGIDTSAALPDTQYIREGVGGSYDTPLQNVVLDSYAALDEYRKRLGIEDAYAEYDEAFFAEQNRLALVSFPTTAAPADYALNALSFAEDNTTLIVEITKVHALNATTVWQLLQFAVPLSASIPRCDQVKLHLLYRTELPENGTPLTPVLLADIEDTRSYHLSDSAAAKRFSTWFLSPYAEQSRTYYTALGDEFFQTHDLIVVPIEGGSGSIGYRAANVVKEENGSVTVKILTLRPDGALTGDMSYGQIIIPVKKGLLNHSDSLYTHKVNVTYFPVTVARITVK